MKILNKIGKEVTKITGDPRSSNFIKQRLSLAIQRGNSARILGTLPISDNLDEVYLI